MEQNMERKAFMTRNNDDDVFWIEDDAEAAKAGPAVYTIGDLARQFDATLRALSHLKELGVQLSIADFGTGYSSLSYLSRFPLDELKIDRSFVIDLNKSNNDASLVIAIIAMARSLRLDLVAEGVETPEQYHFLRTHRANVIQGYLFSKPVPFAELKDLLAPGYFKEQIAELNAY